MKCPCCKGKGYVDEEKDPEGIFSMKIGCVYCHNLGTVTFLKRIHWVYWKILNFLSGV